MAITIPDRKQIRITNDFSTPHNAQALPAVLASVGMTNQGAVSIDPASTVVAGSGQTYCIPSAGSNGASGYIGFNPEANIPAGSPISPCKGVIVDGFAGVSPGVRVFIDATSADNSSTSSGLTHTQPTNGVSGGIGVGWSTTKILFH